MSEAAERTVKSTQEQAVASWIMFLNQRRLEILIDRLNQQDINLEEALNELNEIKKFIGDAEHILGNASTKHGEIAEVMQVRIANARRLIKGLREITHLKVSAERHRKIICVMASRFSQNFTTD